MPVSPPRRQPALGTRFHFWLDALDAGPRPTRAADHDWRADMELIRADAALSRGDAAA
jgi:hypothetical protein